MIVGNGLIATSFRNWFESEDKVLVFASGVSNSNETDSRNFAREEALLRHYLALAEYHFIYFSTCSIDDLDRARTAYVQHKRRMEDLVRTAERFQIFRLPQIVGRTPNPHTLANYLCRKIRAGESFKVWRKARRNLIDVDDVAKIVAHMITEVRYHQSTVNIANTISNCVTDIVDIFERVLKRKAVYEVVDAGASYPIDVTASSESARLVGIQFGEDYLLRMIEKYRSEKHTS